MYILDLDDNQSDWKIRGDLLSKSRNRASRSQYHLKARLLLHEIFPTLQIFEEVPIVVRKGKTLYLDFFILLRKMAIEVHGEQHYKFIPHFHHNIQGFINQKKNDREKVEWCEKNGLEIISLSYNEGINEWRQKFI